MLVSIILLWYIQEMICTLFHVFGLKLVIFTQILHSYFTDTGSSVTLEEYA